ncbi:MAG: ABC transporter permease [Acidobacteriota bacterium]|nr:MAG: ABC transporter permease [Acidobacteriota bacterium]
MSSSAIEMSTSSLGPMMKRRGLVHWLRSYALLVEWEARSLRLLLPLAIVAQILLGAGLAIGFGFLMGEIPTIEAQFLATGVTVISMITVGLVLVPQIVSQRKYAGIYDYMWSLPVPRTSSVAASLTVNSFIALPGMVLALLVASWRFDLSLQISPLVVPAALLTLVSAASVGFALAHAISNPLLTNLVTNVLLFVILLYSPINFPPDRLPGWLASLHHGLPFQHAANVMRAGLTEGLATHAGESFAILAGWAAAAWIITAWVVGRRP